MKKILISAVLFALAAIGLFRTSPTVIAAQERTDCYVWLDYQQTLHTSELGPITPEGMHVRSFDLSPDETTIVAAGSWDRHFDDGTSEYLSGLFFLSPNEDGNWHTNMMILEDNSLGSFDNPSFSPDGTQVVFQAIPPSLIDGIAESSELYVIKMSGMGPYRLTSNITPDIDPDWGKNGIVFSTEGRIARLARVTLSSVDSAQTTFDLNFEVDVEVDTHFVLYYDELGIEPTWSPDGQWIAYTTPNRDTFVMSINGGTPSLVVEGSLDLFSFGPSFSADGTSVFFTASPRSDLGSDSLAFGLSTALANGEGEVTQLHVGTGGDVIYAQPIPCELQE